MPIYEYHCAKCGCDFEELVRSSSAKIACPQCGCKKVGKLMSVFAHKSSGEVHGSNGGSNCSGCSSSNCSTCGH
jgi:putative FmdB family regulatory protein